MIIIRIFTAINTLVVLFKAKIDCFIESILNIGQVSGGCNYNFVLEEYSPTILVYILIKLIQLYLNKTIYTNNAQNHVFLWNLLNNFVDNDDFFLIKRKFTVN